MKKLGNIPLMLSMMLAHVLHPIPYTRPNKASPRKLALALTGPTDVIEVHGIFDDDKQPTSWVHAGADAFAAAGFVTSWLSYWTGLFLWGNGANADKLAVMIRACRAAGARRIVLVCHSNGCLLALMALAQNADIVIDDLWLIAAAAKPDCNSNGLNGYLAAGRVGRVFCGISANDGIVGSFAQWIDPAEWGNTMGVDGLPNCSPAPVPCSFAALATMDLKTDRVFVGRRDEATHLTWMDQVVFQTVIAVEKRAA